MKTPHIFFRAPFTAMFVSAAAFVITAVLFAASPFAAFAQEQPEGAPPTANALAVEEEESGETAEALLQGPLRSSGYGALSMKFTPIQGQFGTMLGGYGGWFINKTLLIGGGGYGLATAIPASERPGANISLGYGGFVVEYVGNSDKVFHYAVQTLIGWGGVGTYPQRGFTFSSPYPEFRVSPIFVVEPSVLAELNLTKFLRLAVGAGYRFASGIDLEGISNADISTFSMIVNLKFGSF